MTPAAPRVAVLDYGSGNLRSAVRAVERAGADVVLTADPTEAENAAGLLVPGVGAFESCMRGLRSVDGERIIERRLIAGRPVLGICVGMQILFGEGIEHGVRTAGCGEWPGTVERLQADIVPHMGWNTVEVAEGSRMFAGIADERFYFVHSYGVRRWELEGGGPFTPPQVTWTNYDSDRFVAGVEHGPLWATQFHPEKSGDAGRRLLENWLATL
ncbi:imidazole glycerol phosphate synthase subunit HisH [Aeromicrobium phragmitis]|uniref:Imidazole glycerol phosphate synthase subunit HisH n=1 Tax=Aeromicrobium phragmitis TaxID=2478914 RepID=A0A3L8PN25_9ACTN|nr:imidazole glycerol phosphate synthase subunit HisH [Aeromicrobium phragmitis]RLV55898.1 imidazole glycerol phosphate synthase subunit HisH [Aeromicrobium phragmitis]